MPERLLYIADKWLRFAVGALLLTLLVLVIRYLIAPIPDPGDSIVRQSRSLMGTVWEIQVALAEDQSKEEALLAISSVWIELERIESVMSEWRDDSPISSLNRAAGEGFVEIPDELAQLLRRGLDYGQSTSGAFDITWRGLGHLWELNESFEPPSDAAVESALKYVGAQRVLLDGTRVSIPEGYSIGLGGIAKGYAIDRAGMKLKEVGYTSFLVNGGGDILTSGTRNGRTWTIGIRNPRGLEGELISRVSLTSGAVVTSGDYERFQIVDGIRYHHIIDPRTGRPSRECQSVTVIADSAEVADVLATAIFVLGPSEGLEVARRFRVEVLIIDSSGKLSMTDSFLSFADFAGG